MAAKTYNFDAQILDINGEPEKIVKEVKNLYTTDDKGNKVVNGQERVFLNDASGQPQFLTAAYVIAARLRDTYQGDDTKEWTTRVKRIEVGEKVYRPSKGSAQGDIVLEADEAELIKEYAGKYATTTALAIIMRCLDAGVPVKEKEADAA